MMRDDKLVRVAIRSKQSIERVLWVWGAILESAAEVDDNGRFDFDIAEAAYFLRTDESDVAAIVDALSAQDRIAENNVVNWSARQFTSDRSAERQRRYRERKKGCDVGATGVDEPCESDSDGEVTSLSRHGDAPETETETDIPSSNDEGVPRPEENQALRVEHLVEAFNELAKRRGLPLVKKLEGTRLRRAQILIRRNSIDDITEAIDAIDRSPWMHGQNDKGWRADFDFFLQPKSFTKLIEGSYDGAR
jgi:hypothetical protein